MIKLLVAALMYFPLVMVCVSNYHNVNYAIEKPYHCCWGILTEFSNYLQNVFLFVLRACHRCCELGKFGYVFFSIFVCTNTRKVCIAWVITTMFPDHGRDWTVNLMFSFSCENLTGNLREYWAVNQELFTSYLESDFYLSGIIRSKIE